MQELDTLEEVMDERKLSKEVSKTAEFVTGAAPRLPKVIYRKVASSRLSRLVAHFQTVYEGEL